MRSILCSDSALQFGGGLKEFACVVQKVWQKSAKKNGRRFKNISNICEGEKQQITNLGAVPKIQKRKRVKQLIKKHSTLNRGS